MQSNEPIIDVDLHDLDDERPDAVGIATTVTPMQLTDDSLAWLSDVTDQLSHHGGRAAIMLRHWVGNEQKRRGQDADDVPVEATPALVNCSHWTMADILGAVEFYSHFREVAAKRPRLVRDFLNELFTIHLAWARARAKHSDPNATGNAPR
jgi:hypothetical protein